MMLVALSVLACAVSSVSGEWKLPKNWAEDRAKVLNPSADVNFKVALKAKQSLVDVVKKISTPGSPDFRKYVTQDQIRSMVGRSDSEIERVKSWISSVIPSPVVDVHPHGDWLFVKGSIQQVETLLNTTLVSFVNHKKDIAQIGAKDGVYTIPEHIRDLVELVSGLATFSLGHWDPIVLGADGASLYDNVTPDSIYANYGAPNEGSHGSKLGSQAVVEFGNLANFNTADTQTFFTQFAPSQVGETCGVVEGDNNGDIRGSVEANLDVQYMMAAGPFVNTSDYKITFDSSNIEDAFLDYCILVNGQSEPPLVHSISYGEYGGSYDNATDQRFSYELQKMGISGITVLLASGDNGVGCNTAGTEQEFDFPDSPYITMVGATYIDSKTKKEVGATLSSGGFSKDFWVADWQADAVNAYLTNPDVKMPSEKFYAPGRAYPDLSAYGQGVQVVAGGKVTSVAGTSCSAPIIGGLIASLNNELLQKGQAPLGYINPWLYANPQMFTDVTEGSNPYEKCDGFQAAAGWDPVTGMGTPLYPKMLEAAFAALEVKA